MTYRRKSIFERVLAAVLVALMVIALMPVNLLQVAAEEVDGEGEGQPVVLVGTIAQTGNVSVNDNAVTINGTIEKFEGNVDRGAGWWVAVDVTATGYVSGGKYGPGSASQDIAAATTTIWCQIGENGSLLSPTSYIFDWDGENGYAPPQEITFAVGSVTLMDGGTQVYPQQPGGDPAPEETPTGDYTVTVAKNAGGTVTLQVNDAEPVAADSVPVNSGDKVAIAVAPEAGYWISAVTIDGQAQKVTDPANYTIDAVAADVAVEVTFVKVYTISVADVTGGDVVRGTVSMEIKGEDDTYSPVEGNGVAEGAVIKVTASPNAGYRVKSVIFNSVEQVETAVNNVGYSTEFTVGAATATSEGAYTIEVTFEPNTYSVGTVEVENGSYTIQTPNVQHDGSTEVTVTPHPGFMVDTFGAEGCTVSELVKDENGIRFTVSNIQSNLDVNVTFKAISAASFDDIIKDTAAGEALRTNDDMTLFVVGKTDGVANTVTFTTVKTGMRMSDGTNWVGGKDINSLAISGGTTITKVELYYKDDAAGDLYEEWHAVDMDGKSITVAVDETAPTLSIAPATQPQGGFYNSDVTMNVTAEDQGNYSGIAKVEYRIKYNEEEGTWSEMTGVSAGAQSYTGIIEIDASTYDSGEVTVYLKVTDKAGNEATTESTIRMNAVVPKIQLQMEGTQEDNALVGYYNNSTKLTITIEDKSFDADAFVNGLQVKRNGTPIPIDSYIVWRCCGSEATHVGDIHTCTCTFDGEARYDLAVSYTNAAGTQGVIDIENSNCSGSFVIDYTAPTIEGITYSSSVLDTVIDNISFGFYQTFAELTITATDDVAGIQEFVCSYADAEGTIIEVAPTSDITYDGNKASQTFQIPAQFRNKVSFKAVDKSGQASALLEGDKVVVVDAIAPGVTVEYTGDDVSNGSYYNGNRTATIRIEEDNFFVQDLTDVAPGAENAYLVIKVEKTSNDGTTITENVTPAFNSNGNVHTATIDFTEEAVYKFSIQYTDRSGNQSAGLAVQEFTIDTTVPVIDVEFDDKPACHNGDRVATITVTDRNFDANGVVASVTANGQSDEQYTDYLKNNAIWTHNGDKHTASITFDADAHYTFDITCTDLAGNETSTDFEEVAFTVDKTLPKDLNITYEPVFGGALLEAVTFGFYKVPVKVTIEATDTTAGIDSFTYIYEAQAGSDATNWENGTKIESADFDSNEDGTAKASFEIPAQFRGFVSFIATDKAGNSEDFFDANCVVVDTVAPGITVEYDKIDAENGKYFAENRVATIKITESNFFAEDLTQINPVTSEEYLVITVEKTLDDGTYSLEKVKPVFTKDGDVYTATISFDQNADYTFDIKYTDRAGNTYDSYEMDEFTIDKVKPEISVSYDNDEVVNGKYYKDGRTATITVVEHNFRADDIAFDIVAKDVTGATVDLSAKGYVAYLQNQDNWTKSGDTYTAQITLDIEGNYTIGMTYTDLAGNAQETSIAEDFCIDGGKPENLKVSYAPAFVDVVLDAITFGFYKAPVQVTIEATDEYAGIDYFVYSYDAQEGTSSIAGETDVRVESEEINYTGNKASYTFEIPVQFRGKVSFTAVDHAGNTETTADNRVVVVDNVAPGVRVTYDNDDVKHGKYYSADRIATIAITEANFFEADLADELLVITVGKTIDGTTTTTKMTPAFTKNGDVYTATVEFTENADYTFAIEYTDRSGNEYDGYVTEFVIDKVAPVVEVAFDNNSALNTNQYKEKRVATITVTEKHFVAGEVVASVTANGQDAAQYTEYLKDANNWTSNGDVHTAKITFEADAHYTFDIACTDLVGNTSADFSEVAFTVDKTKPVGLKITYEPEFVDVIMETLTFGFYKAPVTVTIEATDETAGVDYFTYSYAVQENSSATNTGRTGVVIGNTDFVSNDGKTATASFQIPAQFRGFVSFVATDKAGNSEDKLDEKCVVVDTVAPGITVEYDKVDAENGKYFDEDREATIKITEANFFEKDIEDGLLVITVEKTLDNGTSTTTNVKPNFVKSGDVYTAKIQFNENADYTFDIKYTDRAGNVYDSYTKDVFTVDKVKPELSIAYDNNEAENNKYYNEGRTATIKVVEHNFNAADIDFDIVAKDVTGTEIDLSAKGYAAYLQNQANWTKSGDTYTAQITLDIEGNYIIDMSYADLAGNEQVAPIHEDFCIDQVEPQELKISYNPTFVGVVLENLTFGFYKAPVQVTIEATDEYAGVDYFKYTYAVQNGASSTNVGKTDVVVESDDIAYSGKKASHSFNIPAQFRGKVSFTVVDKAGNSNGTNDQNIVVVDDVKPVVEVTYDNNNVEYGKYYNADRVATITVTEANFFQQDVEDGLLVIKVKETLNDGTSTETIEKLTFTKKAEDVYTATREFRNDADYVLDIQYTDRSGNKADGVKNEFTIDKIQPTISVSYDNNTCINENQFDADRTATIVVTEHNFIADEVVSKITVGGELSEAYAAQLKDAAKWTSDGDVHTIKLLFDTDAQYVFGVECADMAGNMNTAVDYGTSVAPEEFTVDKTAPTELAITINDVSVLDDNDIAFDTFYKESVVVKLGANGDVSGIADLQYQKVVIADDYDVNGTWSDYDETQGIVVNPTEKFIIYMRAIDNAGNIAYANSTGIVVDDKAPVGERNAPSIDITTMGGGTGGLYRGDVGLNVAVVEPKYVGELADAEGYYSGLKSVSYRIVTTDTDASESGVLFDASKGNGATFDDDGLAMTWSGNMTIPASKFNSNNIVVSVTAVDNAGNIRTSSIAAGSIKIDITAPTVEVTYDNNDGDATFEGETYFNADRVATIVVTERNFVPSQVKLDITNSDGTVPTISGWSTTKTGGNGDGTTHTAHVVFSEDGDYTVAVSCSDQAGSTNKETVAKNSIAPWEFTIDKTAPVVEVDYDNDNVYNDSYYNETRVATIRVTEHNFETGRIVPHITATEDDKPAEVPTIGNWSSSGDVHTATVVYPGNAHYTFDIDYTDKAGNVSADMAEHSFYVDKTPPTLKIEKVADEKAYGDEGDIGFVIEATDINFDEFKPVVTAVVRNGEKFETNEIKLGTPETITHGQRYTVTNLEADGIYRIECTVVDKAGNAFTEVTLEDKEGKEKVEQRTGEDTLVTFSVNRDGSTYEIDDKTMEVVEQYYVQNVNENLVVVEINVNPLEKYAVTLNGKELVENTDYTVKSEGGDGKWMKYTYEVFSTLFAEEGEYKLVVSSTDEAKNNAFSDVKAASVGFVVDRTAPVVTVSGIAEDGRYQTDKQVVTLIPTDDGGALNSLVVNMVDEEGKVLKEVKKLAGDALMEELNANAGSITFELEEGMYQNVQIICTDCAIGDSGSTNTYETIIKNVSVSSSTFMILWANTAVRWAAVGGVGVVGASVTGSVVFKRRRRKLFK